MFLILMKFKVLVLYSKRRNAKYVLLVVLGDKISLSIIYPAYQAKQSAQCMKSNFFLLCFATYPIRTKHAVDFEQPRNYCIKRRKVLMDEELMFSLVALGTCCSHSAVSKIKTTIYVT